MYCSVFYVALCVSCFRRQYVLLGLLGDNVRDCMFKVAMCVVCLRWQCVLLYVLGGNVCCWVF